MVNEEVYIKCADCGTLQRILHLEWDLIKCPRCGATLFNCLGNETEMAERVEKNKAVYYWE